MEMDEVQLEYWKKVYKCTGDTISVCKSRQVILAQTFKHLIISLFKSAFISILREIYLKLYCIIFESKI